MLTGLNLFGTRLKSFRNLGYGDGAIDSFAHVFQGHERQRNSAVILDDIERQFEKSVAVRSSAVNEDTGTFDGRCV